MNDWREKETENWFSVSKETHLYVEQPWAEVVDALVAFLHAPHHQVEGVAGEEALVGGVVHLLASQVPRTEYNLHQMLLKREISLETSFVLVLYEKPVLKELSKYCWDCSMLQLCLFMK